MKMLASIQNLIVDDEIRVESAVVMPVDDYLGSVGYTEKEVWHEENSLVTHTKETVVNKQIATLAAVFLYLLAFVKKYTLYLRFITIR